MVSFPASLTPALQAHLDAFSSPGADALVFANEHGQPLRRGNFNSAVGWASIRDQLGVPGLHLHDLRHTGKMTSR